MSLAAPSCVQKLRTASPAPCSELWSVCLFREPDAGNLPVRFDEREEETEPSQTGLRRRCAKVPSTTTGRLKLLRLFSTLLAITLRRKSRITHLESVGARAGLSCPWVGHRPM